MRPDAVTPKDLTDPPQTQDICQTNALPRFASPSPFSRALQRRLRVYSRSQSHGRFAGRSQWMFAVAAFGAMTAGFTLLATQGATFGWPLLLAVSVGIGLAAFMILVQVGHDAAHGSVSRRRWVNDAIVFASFGILGVSGALWKDRHLRLHHPYPNVPGTGIDADSSNVVRMAPDKPWRWYHRFQPFYAPVLFVFGTLSLCWIEDMLMFRNARRERPRQFGGVRPLIAFAATKLFHASLFIALPLTVGGLSAVEWLVFYVVSTGAASLTFALLVIGTHVSDHAHFPKVDSDGRLSVDWATLQLITSVDWSPTSKTAAMWSGGANAHTAHHLFPGYSHTHAPALAKIVMDAAAEAGLPYRAVTFADMVAGQFRHMQNLGGAADASAGGRPTSPLPGTAHRQAA